MYIRYIIFLDFLNSNLEANSYMHRINWNDASLSEPLKTVKISKEDIEVMITNKIFDRILPIALPRILKKPKLTLNL